MVISMTTAQALAPQVSRLTPRGAHARQTRTWVMADTTVPGLLAGLPDGDVIPMPVIRDLIGWTRDAQANVVTEGLIRPLPVRGRAGCWQVSRDDAVTILVAAALAFAAGVAVISMLRAIVNTGLDARVIAFAMKVT